MDTLNMSILVEHISQVKQEKKNHEIHIINGYKSVNDLQIFREQYIGVREHYQDIFSLLIEVEGSSLDSNLFLFDLVMDPSS